MTVKGLEFLKQGTGIGAWEEAHQPRDLDRYRARIVGGRSALSRAPPNSAQENHGSRKHTAPPLYTLDGAS